MNTHRRALRGRLPVRSLLGAALLLALAGCASGPDFKSPSQDVIGSTKAYTPQALPAQTDSAKGTGGAAQAFHENADIPAQWWTLFQSPELDQWIRAALNNNPGMAAAQASLLQAKENLAAQTGSLDYPSVGVQAGAQREHQNAASVGKPGGATFNLYNASVAVSYSVDVFGLNHRTLEGAQAQVDYQRYQLEATYLALTSNVVTTAIREASLRAQLQATKDVLDAQEKQLAVVDKQFSVGAIPRASLLSQRNQVAQTRALLPGLQKQLEQTRHALAVLAGEFPADAKLPQFTLESLHLPTDLPVSLPSELVRHRPDIRASEELLHQASAQVGVATAAQYPQFTLSANYGGGATTIGNMFSSGNTAWSLGGSMLAPIFNGGSLSAKKRAAEAGYKQAFELYRSTVLTAFQNVADTLRALEDDATALKAQADAEAVAKESLDLATQQYKLGAVSYLVLLDAQRSYQQAHIGLVQAQATRYADTAALFQAMGGGWWQRDALASATSTSPTATEKQ